MKILLLVALAGSAMGLSMPTLAQRQKTINPEVRKQIEAVSTQFQDAYNRHDPAAVSALYSPDAVELRSWRGLLSGQDAIARMFAFDFASSGGKMAIELVHLCPVGNAICEIAHSNVGDWKDQSVTIYVRDSDTWKMCMVYVNYSPEEKNAIDPEVRQQIEATLGKFDEAYNSDDQAAIAALHTQDAVEVRSWGGANYLRTGRQAIATQYDDDYRSHPKLVTKIGEVYPIGTDVCAMMDLTVGTLKGHAAKIFVRNADTWKIGMAYLEGSPGT
jgi:ketosteroid isomerase-like protein